MKNTTYFTERNNKNTILARKILRDLPEFCYDFFTGVENTTSALTRLNYAYDLRVFFDYLFNETNVFNGKNINTLEPEDLANVKASHIERFVSYLTTYEDRDGKVRTNNERGKSRKLATVRAFFKYFYRKELIPQDVSSKVSMPKLHEKSIIRLETDEIPKFLNTVESGYGLSGHAVGFHKKTQRRDIAMLTLLLGTGMRVSECVGLNLTDIDFKINGLKITRKGGNQVVLYFSDEVKVPLVNYINERAENPYLKDEPALFCSLQNKRITPRAVQNLVKKYASIVTPLKHITPHKLRSTYGTALYRETGDIYIVADVLGHKDVNTTKKHYAAISEDLRRNAANKVRLRD